MKNVMTGSVIAAAFALAGTAMGSSTNATTHATAVQVHADITHVSYIQDQQTNWAFTWSSNETTAPIFDAYFTLSGESNNASHTANAKRKAFEENKCNFYYGNPLQQVITTQGQKTLTATPKAPAIYVARTGWASTTTGGGFGDGVEVTISGVYVQVQTFMQKAKMGSGPNAWTQKYNFNFVLEDLKIEVVREADEEPQPAMALFDFIGANSGDVAMSSADYAFNLNEATKAGNSTAILSLKGDSLTDSDNMMNAILGSDNFHGNNGQGGARASIAPLTYQITEPGTYTFKITGKAKSVETGISQNIDATVGVVEIGDCVPAP